MIIGPYGKHPIKEIDNLMSSAWWGIAKIISSKWESLSDITIIDKDVKAVI